MKSALYEKLPGEEGRSFVARAHLLVLFAVGSVYFYGGLFGFDVWEGGRVRSKALSLLREENVTGLNVQGWNVSVDVSGYRTGSLYCEVFEHGNVSGDFSSEWLLMRVLFEVEGIVVPSEFYEEVYGVGTGSLQFDVSAGRLWVSLFATYEWGVVSLSVYLRG